MADFETMLETDASQYGLSAVLLQSANKNCPWMPVQFASRTLNSSERNYSNIERKPLSVVLAQINLDIFCSELNLSFEIIINLCIYY